MPKAAAEYDQGAVSARRYRTGLGGYNGEEIAARCATSQQGSPCGDGQLPTIGSRAVRQDTSREQGQSPLDPKVGYLIPAT